MGSPGYASPEQASRKFNELTTASDVFSLGAILYRLVTGQAPFPTEDWDEFVQRASQGSFQRPSVLNPQVDADLEAICLHCLEPDPRKRASSAASLADQLDHWLKRKPLDPDWRSTPVWERSLKWVTRRWQSKEGRR
jgi:serine/threonine-protein kinase